MGVELTRLISNSSVAPPAFDSLSSADTATRCVSASTKRRLDVLLFSRVRGVGAGISGKCPGKRRFRESGTCFTAAFFVVVTVTLATVGSANAAAVSSSSVAVGVSADATVLLRRPDEGPTAVARGLAHSALEFASAASPLVAGDGQAGSAGTESYRARQRRLALRAAAFDAEQEQLKLRQVKSSLIQTRAAAAEREAEADATDILHSLSHGVNLGSALNPRSRQKLNGSDVWLPWPGLRKDISLQSDCVVIIQYQATATLPKKYKHLLSRLVIDSAGIRTTRSAAGGFNWASNFGAFIGHLSSGVHTVEVQYRTDVDFEHNPTKGDIMDTRSLNILTLPEAEVLASNPWWGFTLKPSEGGNTYDDWEGLKHTSEFEPRTTVMTYFSATLPVADKLSSRVMVDGLVAEETVTTTDQGNYSQVTNIFATKVPAGKHVWTTQFQTTTSLIFDAVWNDWVARSFTIVALQDAEVFSRKTAKQPRTFGEQWTPWPNLSRQIAPTSDRYAIAFYHVPLIFETGKATRMRMVLTVNGKKQPQTLMKCPQVRRYCAVVGMWMGIVTSGIHNFEVMYVAENEFLLRLPRDRKPTLSIILLSRLHGRISSLLQLGEES
eukprot:TRINITY_DN11125_c0_g1_i2.p1 TRINITY_DN11125_c0_g1~~TRINITY_DN11125_c0_g1_i2.p1  ORF type:complete len:609 (+),score=97.56 TRINITY_DN11125_c0_g1_i2:174-2000(+)